MNTKEYTQAQARVQELINDHMTTISALIAIQLKATQEIEYHPVNCVCPMCQIERIASKALGDRED